jgi:RecA-family ATPase
MTRTDGPKHSLRDLLALAGPSPTEAAPKTYEDIEQAANQLNSKRLLKRYIRLLPSKVRSLLRRKKIRTHNTRLIFRGTTLGIIPKDDCSERCFEIAYGLRLAGATPPEALAITMDTIFWKDRVQRCKEEDPARFIAKVFDRAWGDIQFASKELVSVSPTGWADQPVPVHDWLVRELVPMKKVTLLYGDGGTGKTLLAMQLAVCVACDRHFLGQPTKKGGVYALLAEDDEDDARITLDAVCHHYDVNLRDLEALRIALRASFDNIVVHFQQDKPETTVLFKQLLADIKLHKPILVILDTAADLFGGNENNRSQVRFFISNCCQRIALETGAAVLLCAHPSAEGLRSGRGTGGSTAWSNSARARLYLYRDLDDKTADETEPDFRWLEVKKSNLGPTGQRIGLRWQLGAFRVDVQQENTSIERSRREERLIEEVETAFENDRPWSAHPQARGRWLGTWLHKKERMNRSPAQKLIDELVSRGLIVEVEYDSHRHRSGLCTPQQKEDFLRAKQAR